MGIAFGGSIAPTFGTFPSLVNRKRSAGISWQSWIECAESGSRTTSVVDAAVKLVKTLFISVCIRVGKRTARCNVG